MVQKLDLEDPGSNPHIVMNHLGDHESVTISASHRVVVMTKGWKELSTAL